MTTTAAVVTQPARPSPRGGATAAAVALLSPRSPRVTTTAAAVAGYMAPGTIVLKKVGNSRKGKRFARKHSYSLPRILPHSHLPVATAAEVQLFFHLRPQYTKGGKVDFGKMVGVWNQHYYNQLSHIPDDPQDVIHSKDKLMLMKFQRGLSSKDRLRASTYMSKMAVAKVALAVRATQPTQQPTLAALYPKVGSARAASTQQPAQTPGPSAKKQKVAAGSADSGGALAQQVKVKRLCTYCAYFGNVAVKKEGHKCDWVLVHKKSQTDLPRGTHFSAPAWLKSNGVEIPLFLD